MKLRPQPNHNPLFDPFAEWAAEFERAMIIHNLLRGPKVEAAEEETNPEEQRKKINNHWLSLIQSSKVPSKSEEEEEVEEADLWFQEEADAVELEILKKYRLFANLATSLKLDLKQKLVARAQEGALCSEQSQFESHAAAAPADPQAERLGLTTLCLTPRLLAQRPIAARVCAGLHADLI
jgi:hypothetical protein